MHESSRRAIDQTRWFRAGVGLVAVGMLALCWSAICTAPGIPWNPARLAPSFALARGLPIYQLRDSGAQLGWIYGPVFPLWNLPFAFTNNPTSAHLLAATWNIATLLAPLALLLFAVGAAAGWRLAAMLVVAAVLLAGNSVTSRGYYFLHVDAVCLAWGLLACVSVHRAVRTGRLTWLQLAAAALAFAFWSKQLSVALYPALLFWLWREGAGRLISRFLFWMVVYGGAITVIFFSCFGAQEMLFNIWYVPVHTPWHGGASLLMRQLAELAGTASIWLPLALTTIWMRRRAPAPPPSASAAAMIRLLLTAAAWQLPLGLAATLKSGGGLNSVHSLHYGFAAGLIYFVSAASQPAGLPGPASRKLSGLILVSLFLPLLSAFQGAWENGTVWTPFHGQERLLSMARAQPGRYYFPWNPLVTIISDHRVYPLDDALYCLWHAGVEVPAEKVRATVPTHPIILYEEPAQSHFALRYFSGGSNESGGARLP